MRRGVILLAIILILSGFAIAQTQIGNPSNLIEKKYSSGGFLKGWINISLNEVEADSVLQTSLEDSIGILELIKINEETNNVAYACSPLDCNSDFSSIGSGESSKTFSLADRESELIGLRFSGGSGFGAVEDFSMRINSNAPESNFRQLLIDVFDDGTTDWQAYKSSGNFYEEDFGCYDVSQEQPYLTTTQFCEKINIPIAPEVEIGAYIIDSSNPSATFKLTLINEQGGSEASCDATVFQQGRVSCIPQNFKVNEAGDYYVCINAKTSTDSFKYKINSKINGTVCGYAASTANPRDFEIFAKPGKFMAVGIFELNNSEISKSGGNIQMESEIENYTADKYDGDCTEECIIPIRIISGKNQQQDLTLDNINIKYNLQGIDYLYSGDFNMFEITETPATITSGFIQLYLDYANFSVPIKFGEHTISVNLDGTQIFSDKIEIEKKPEVVSITPTIAIAAFPTEFTADIETFDSLVPIINYQWNFGDNQTSTTATNIATHTYNAIGSYTLSLTITDAQGQTSTKSFEVKVATPKEAVNTLLKRNFENLNNIKTTIDALTPFERDSLNSVLDFDNLEIQLSSVQQKNATAVSDGDYVSAMSELVALKIPESIETTKSVESVLFYPPRESVNLNILQKIGGGDYIGNEEKYTDAIVAWELINTKTMLSSKEFTASYENNNEEVLNTFELDINDGASLEGTYLIMPKFEGLFFAQDYSQKEEGSNIYMQINGGEKIIFATTENIEFAELPAFISPPLSKLSIQKGFIIDTEKISKQTLIILVILLVTFIGFIIYLVMQQWYKKKYENYLFKSKNDLYNLVSYIQNMKKQGVDDGKVSAGLKKSGWNSEQVTYIIKKYYGKRTGMFEIPLSNIINLFRGKTNFGSYPSIGTSEARKFNKGRQ